LQPQSFLKKLGLLYTHETRDLCSFHSLLVEPLKRRQHPPLCMKTLLTLAVGRSSTTTTVSCKFH
jgi:hypothetical protein